MPTRKPTRCTTGAVPKAQSRNTVPQEAVTPTRRDVHASNLVSSLDWVPVSEQQMRGMQQQQQQQHLQQQQQLQQQQSHQQQQLQQQQQSHHEQQQLQSLNPGTTSRKSTNGRLDHGEIDQQTFEGGGRFVPVRPQPRVTVQPRDAVSSNNSDDMSFQYSQMQQAPVNGMSHGAAAVMIVNPTTPNAVPNDNSQSPLPVQNFNQGYMGNRTVTRLWPSFRNSTNCVNLAAANNMNGNTSTAIGSGNPDRQGATKSSNLLNNGCALLQHANMESEMEVTGGGDAAGICPDSAQVEARLGQIREYIRVTSSLVDNMRNDEDEETIARPQSVQSNGSTYSDNELWQNELKVKMEMSQQRLAALHEQQKQLLKYQSDAKQQLAEASNHHNRSANESVPHPDTSSNADSLQSHHMYGEECQAPACNTASSVDTLTNQMAALQSQLSQDSLQEEDFPESAHSTLLKEKLRELKMKKKHMENLVAEFQSLRNGHEYVLASEHSRPAAIAATKPIPNMQLRQGPPHTQQQQQGVAHPLQGLTYTEQSHLQHTPTYTQHGTTHPQHNLTYTQQATTHPQQGPANTQGTSHPHNGPIYTQQGLTYAQHAPTYTQQGPINIQQGALNTQHGPSNTHTAAPESDESEADVEEPSHDEESVGGARKEKDDDWKIRELNAMKEKLERLKGIMQTVDNIETRLTSTVLREEPELDTSTQSQRNSDSMPRNEPCTANSSSGTEQDWNKEGATKTQNVSGVNMARLQNYIAANTASNANNKIINERQHAAEEPLSMNISALQQLTEQMRQETLGLAEDRNRLKRLSRNESEASYADKKVNSDSDRRQAKPKRSMGPIEMKQLALKEELEEKKKQLEMLINKQMQTKKQLIDTRGAGVSVSGESSNTATARAASVSSAVSCSAYSARRPDPDTGYMSEQDDTETCVSSAVDRLASTPHGHSAANHSGETVVHRSSLDPYKGDNSNSLCGESMLTFDTWSRSVMPAVGDAPPSELTAHPHTANRLRPRSHPHHHNLTDKSHSRTSKSCDKPPKSWRNRQPSMGSLLGETDEETWGAGGHRSAVSAATVPHADHHLTDNSHVTSGPVEHSPWWNHKSNQHRRTNQLTQNCQSQTVEQQMLSSPMPSLLPMPMPPITPAPMLMPYGMMSPYWYAGWSQPSMEGAWLSAQQRDLLQHCSHQLLHQQREIDYLRNSMAHLEEQYHALLNGTISRAHSTPHNMQMAGNNPQSLPVMRAQSAQSNACYTQCQAGAFTPHVVEPPQNRRSSRSNAQFTTRSAQRVLSPGMSHSSPYSGSGLQQLPEPLLNYSELQRNQFTRDEFPVNPQMFLNNSTQPLHNPNILNNQFPHPALNNLNPNFLINLPVQNPLPSVPVPPLATQTQAGSGAGALNNQVPPGNRANNYWDNFRSYSRQNLLSTSSKTNSESNSSNIQPLAGRSHNNNTLRNPAPPPQPPGSTPKRNMNQPLRDLASDTRDTTQRGRRNIGQDNVPTVAPDVLNLNQNLDTEHANVDPNADTHANGAIHLRSESPATNAPANLNINRQSARAERNLNLTDAIPEIIQGHPNNLNLTRQNGPLKKKSSAKLPAKNTPNSNRYALEYAQNRNLDLSTNSDGAFAPNLNLASATSAGFNDKSTSKLFDLLRENVYSEVTALISANETRPYFLIQLFRDLQQVSSDPLRQQALQSIQEVLMRYTFPSNNEHISESSVHSFDNLTRPTMAYAGETGAKMQESPLVSDSNNESEVGTKICDFIMLHGNEICTVELLDALKNFILNIATEAGLTDVFSDQSLKECLYQYESLRLCHISDELLHNVLTLCPGYDFARSVEVNRADIQQSDMSDSSMVMQDVAGSLLALGLGNGEMVGISQNVTGSNQIAHLQSVSSDTVSDCSKGTLKPVVSVIGEALECGEEYNGDLAEADQSRHREDEEEGLGADLGEMEMDSVAQPTPTEAEAEWLGLEHAEEYPANQTDLTSEYRKT